MFNTARFVIKPVIQHVVACLIKLGKSHLHLKPERVWKNENVFNIWFHLRHIQSFRFLTCSVVRFLQIFWNSWEWHQSLFHDVNFIFLTFCASTTQQDNNAIFLAHLFGDHSIPILVHVLEKLFYGTFLLISYHWKRKKKKSYLAHEFLKAKPSVKVAVHRAKEVLHLLPEFSNVYSSNYFSLLSPCGWHPAWIENTQPLLIK